MTYFIADAIKGLEELLVSRDSEMVLPYDPQIAECEKIMQQAIPEGWIMVLEEPTKEMIDARRLYFMGGKLFRPFNACVNY